MHGPLEELVLERGGGLALAAAALFGLSAPFAKLLLSGAAPQLRTPAGKEQPFLYACCRK